MIPYYGNQPWITTLIDGIEGKGRICSTLVAPHYNLETPGGPMLFIVNNHSQDIYASLINGTRVISASDKVVVVDLTEGSVVTDIRPRAMPNLTRFSHLAVSHEPGYEFDQDPILTNYISTLL